MDEFADWQVEMIADGKMYPDPRRRLDIGAGWRLVPKEI